MRNNSSDNRRWISVTILAGSVPVYAYLCWPAIVRRGFPEIDPFWLAMPWLWIVPIILSGLFDGTTQARKWSVGIYTLLSGFFFAGTFISVVPHHVNIVDMLLATVFPWGPLNLLIAFTVEGISQRISRLLHIREKSLTNDATTMRPFRSGALIIVILALAVGFPFACRAAAFRAARASARADAERDWASGRAIWYVRRGDPEAFGTSGECYSVDNGLKTEAPKPVVSAAIYCDSYREVVRLKLSEFGPADKIKDLCTKADLIAWIKAGRFQRVQAFPLKQGAAEISLKGYNIKGYGNVGCFRGEPSAFLFYATIPEKKDALVVITDDSIWVFDKTGELLQSIDFETYRQMAISEDILIGHR